jgi:hypothetical protein
MRLHCGLSVRVMAASPSSASAESTPSAPGLTAGKVALQQTIPTWSITKSAPTGLVDADALQAVQSIVVLRGLRHRA